MIKKIIKNVTTISLALIIMIQCVEVNITSSALGYLEFSQMLAVTNSAVYLSWNGGTGVAPTSVSKAVDYEIYMSSYSDKDFKNVLSMPGTSMSNEAVITGLTPGKTYYFYFRCYDYSNKTWSYSEVKKYTIPNNVSPLISVDLLADGMVNLRFDWKLDNQSVFLFDDYDFYYSENLNGTYVKTPETGKSFESQVITGLKKNTVYYFKVVFKVGNVTVTSSVVSTKTNTNVSTSNYKLKKTHISEFDNFLELTKFLGVFADDKSNIYFASYNPAYDYDKVPIYKYQNGSIIRKSIQLSGNGGYECKAVKGDDGCYYIASYRSSRANQKLETATIYVDKFDKNWNKIGTAKQIIKNPNPDEWISVNIYSNMIYSNGKLLFIGYSNWGKMTGFQMYETTNNILAQINTKTMKFGNPIENYTYNYTKSDYKNFMKTENDSYYIASKVYYYNSTNNSIYLFHTNFISNKEPKNGFTDSVYFTDKSDKWKYIKQYTINDTLELLSEKGVITGLGVIYEKAWDKTDAKSANNAYMILFDKNNINNYKFKWITNFEPDGKLSVTGIQSVKLSNNEMLLMYEVSKKIDNPSYIGESEYYKTYFAVVNEKGTIVKKAELKARISDVKPIIKDNKIYFLSTFEKLNSNANVSNYYVLNELEIIR